MGSKNAHRLTALNQERLIVLETLKTTHDGIEGLPRARRLAAPTVDNELGGVLRHFWIQIVHQAAERRLLEPALGAKLRAARGLDFSGLAHSISPTAFSTAAMSSPSSIIRATVSVSPATSRSSSSGGTFPRTTSAAARVPGAAVKGAR